MVYVVERYLPGVPQQRIAALARRLARATASLQEGGVHVVYLGSTYVPEDESCFCQFEASSEEAVVDANRTAGFPYDRIVEAIEVASSTSREEKHDG